MNNFYVYVHRRLSDNKPFYVGKGKGNRAYSLSGRNDYWKNTAKKHGFSVELVFEELNEEDSFQCEKDTILEFTYFGYPLTNLTSGGEGSSGIKFTDKQRLNIANGLRNKRYKDVVKNKIEILRPSAYGENNHFADKSQYTFIRLSDGLEITCSRHQLCESFELDKQILKKLFYNVPRKSACGWKLKKD